MTDYERGFREAIEKAVEVFKDMKASSSAYPDGAWDKGFESALDQVIHTIRALSPSTDTVRVPREPTPEMIDRGGREIAFKTQHFGGARTLAHYSSLAVEAENRARAEYAYRAMIAEVK